MTSRLNPYISFEGNARQAMEFYQGRLRRHAAAQHVRRDGRPAGRPDADQIMHGMLETDQRVHPHGLRHARPGWSTNRATTSRSA